MSYFKSELLSDQVRRLERENIRLKLQLEKNQKVRVIFKAKHGFMKCEEMLECDVRPEIVFPDVDYLQAEHFSRDYQDNLLGSIRSHHPRVRVFRLEPQSERSVGFIKSFVYREV